MTQDERTRKVTDNAETLFQVAHKLAGDDSLQGAKDVGISLMIAAVSVAKMTNTDIEALLEGFVKLVGQVYGYEIQKVSGQEFHSASEHGFTVRGNNDVN